MTSYLSVPHLPRDLLIEECRNRLPVDWEQTFACYRYFYAPGYKELVRTYIRDTTENGFKLAVSGYRALAPGLVPERLRVSVEEVQRDWSAIGNDQIGYAFKCANSGLPKLVLSLITLQLYFDDHSIECDVFAHIKIHPAIYRFSEDTASVLKTKVLTNEGLRHSFLSFTRQQFAFLESLANWRPATLQTLELVKEWGEKNLKGINLSTIEYIDYRALPAAAKEKVRPTVTIRA